MISNGQTYQYTAYWIFFQNEHYIMIEWKQDYDIFIYIIFECTNILDMFKLELSFFVPCRVTSRYIMQK